MTARGASAHHQNTTVLAHYNTTVAMQCISTSPEHTTTTPCTCTSKYQPSSSGCVTQTQPGAESTTYVSSQSYGCTPHNNHTLVFSLTRQLAYKVQQFYHKLMPPHQRVTAATTTSRVQCGIDTRTSDNYAHHHNSCTACITSSAPSHSSGAINMLCNMPNTACWRCPPTTQSSSGSSASCRALTTAAPDRPLP